MKSLLVKNVKDDKQYVTNVLAYLGADVILILILLYVGSLSYCDLCEKPFCFSPNHKNLIKIMEEIIFFVIYNLITGMVFYFQVKNINELYIKRNMIKELCSKEKVNDELRCFKHDFNNIIQAIGGYIALDDMKSLEVYYNKLFDNARMINELDNIQDKFRNSPAIFGIILDKYQKAFYNNVTFDLKIKCNLEDIDCNVYEVTRILGILLDNAIEAAIECDERIVSVSIDKDVDGNKEIIKVENSYLNKGYSKEDIYVKEFSTKKNGKNMGVGLSNVKDIVDKNSRIELDTIMENKFFSQVLRICV